MRNARAMVAVAAVATMLATALSACAAATPIQVSNPPTMAPEQNVSAACQVSQSEVDAITQEVKDRIEQAGADVASGNAPNLSGIFDTVGESLDRVSEGIENPEVLAALEKLRSEIDGFGTIKAPDSLLDAPGYVAELTSQLGKVQSAGDALRQLCTAS